MDDMTLAMPSARAATPSGRSRLRVSGIACIAIAVALSGCSPARKIQIVRDDDNHEVIPLAYETIGRIAARDGDPEQAAARAALADGYLTNGEYNAVMNAGYERTKAEVIARFAQGGEARQGGDGLSGSVHEHPVGPADAP